MVDTHAFIPGQDGFQLHTFPPLAGPATERRSAGDYHPANDDQPWSLDRRLVIYRGVTFLMQRRSVEGRIEAIARAAGTAQVRISTPPFTGILRVEPLHHLVPIDVNGRPFTD